MISLDPDSIYYRGLEDWRSLSDPEAVVFILIEFRVLLDMEGEIHFFINSHHFEKLPILRKALEYIGDAKTLCALNQFESYVSSKDHEFTPEGIEGLYCDIEEGGDEFPSFFDVVWNEGLEKRWATARKALLRDGYDLQMD